MKTIPVGRKFIAIKKILLPFFLLFTVMGCKKNNDVTITPSPSSAKIYMAGSSRVSTTQYFPCYWKDGVRTDLAVPAASLHGETYSIVVSGTDYMLWDVITMALLISLAIGRMASAPI